MSDEVYSFALKNTLNEIHNICPDIKHAFIFREDGEIIASDEGTPEEMVVRAVNSFDTVLEKAETIGGIDGVVLENAKGKISISLIENLYMVTVTSKKADKTYVETVTRILVPTILKLLEKISPTPIRLDLPKPEIEPPQPTTSKNERFEEELTTPPTTGKHKPKLEPESAPDTIPEPPMSQFIVENLGGLLVPADTVRIDNEILSQWQQLYPGHRIEEAEIETFGGQTVQCKIKPIKDSKYEGKGMIQVPDKIQNVLDIRKGELVRVKPLVK